MTPRSAAAAAKVTKSKTVLKPRKAAGRAVKKLASKAPAKRAGRVAKDAVHPHPPMAYRLHALLHTMHSIEHHEDHLCTLLTAIEREGEVAPALRRELAALLEALPLQAFVTDLEAARQTLAAGTAKRKRA